MRFIGRPNRDGRARTGGYRGVAPRSKDPFWRNRRWFGIAVVMGLIASTVLAGSVTAAPGGETSFWHLDDGSGSVAADSSASAFDGTVTGATWTAGIAGSALDFTGNNNERVVVNETGNQFDLGADQQVSISLWFNTSATTSAGDEWSLVRRMNAGTGDGYLISLFGTTPQLRFRHEDSGAARTALTIVPLNDGAWHHVVGVIDGAQILMYLDGALVSSLIGVASSSSITEPFVIGGSVTGDPNFDYEGLIDEVAVYPGALTLAQIGDLYDDHRAATPQTTVNSTGDASDVIPGDGDCDTGGTNSTGLTECTLRAAIEESNATPAVTDINFSLPVEDPGHSAGIWTITPGSVLPDVTESVAIDATSQVGWAGAPLVVLDGSSLGAGDSALRIQSSANDSEVRGFSVVAFPDNGLMSGADRTTITDNYIGVMPDGITANGNATEGIIIWGGADSVIDTNLIGGHNNASVVISGTATGTIMTGNTIGTDATGTVDLGNGQGVWIDSSGSNRIGGIGVGDGNTIVNSSFNAIDIEPVANQVTVLGNSIHGNANLGIDINGGVEDGFAVTANDLGDGDTGPNDLLNFPVLTSATESAGTVSIDFDLDVPAGDYRVEFFTNPSGASPSGNGEGEIFVHAYPVVSHPGGSASYSTSYAGSASDIIAATATEDLGGGTFGATSEFSAAMAAGPPILTVNSTGNSSDSVPGNGACDTGALVGVDAECTLRAAIQEANALAGTDMIEFDIPQTDGGYKASPESFTIQPSTLLPAISTPMILDASTQPEYATNNRPVIEVDGVNVSAGEENGFYLTGGGSTLRGFVINNWGDDAIDIEFNGGNTIVGNFVGTNVTGTSSEANAWGINFKTGGNIIGGSTDADRNVVSGNTNDGLLRLYVVSDRQCRRGQLHRHQRRRNFVVAQR